MPRVQVYDMNGEKLKQMNVSKEIFGIEPNEAVMHMAVVNYLANQRQGCLLYTSRGLKLLPSPGFSKTHGIRDF